MSLISRRKFLSDGNVWVVLLYPLQPNTCTPLSFQPAFGAVNFTASPIFRPSMPNALVMVNRERFISETFFPLSCFNAVNFEAVVSAPRELMHSVRQHRQAINNIVFFKLSPQDMPVEFYPYKDSDERLECFLFAKDANYVHRFLTSTLSHGVVVLFIT